MPGFTTHYLFGIDAYKKINDKKIKKNLYHNHSAFALGLQGPDVFFYYLPSYLLHKENLGALAHDTDTGAFSHIYWKAGNSLSESQGFWLWLMLT